MVKGEAPTLPNVPEMVVKEGQALNVSLHPETHSVVFGGTFCRHGGNLSAFSAGCVLSGSGPQGGPKLGKGLCGHR